MNSKPARPRARLACLIGALLPALAGATVYHVDQRGNDANPGSRALPWRSLARASAAPLAAGDRLLLARGSSFSGTLRIAASGSASAPIVVAASGSGPAPRLVNPYFAEHDGHAVEVEGSHVTVQDLFLADTPTPPPDPQPTRWQDSAQHKSVTRLAALFVGRDSKHVIIRNNEFAGALVGVRLRGSNSLVTHNYFHDAAKITEQWGAIAISVVGPHNEVSYNRIDNYGFYGGAYVNDGAAVELDGEDPDYRAHHIHIHHNVSRNVKGGFVEIAGASHDVLIEHNVSDDVDKFVGASQVRNVQIRHNTIMRLRLRHIPQNAAFPLATVFWTFNDKGDDEFEVSNNLFILDGNQRLYQGPDHKLGITPRQRFGNRYHSPNGDITRMLGQPLGADTVLPTGAFVDPARGDYRIKGRQAAAGASATATAGLQRARP